MYTIKLWGFDSLLAEVLDSVLKLRPLRLPVAQVDLALVLKLRQLLQVALFLLDKLRLQSCHLKLGAASCSLQGAQSFGFVL